MKSNNYLGIRCMQLGNLLLPNLPDIEFRTEVMTIWIKLGVPGITEEG